VTVCRIGHRKAPYSPLAKEVVDEAGDNATAGRLDDWPYQAAERVWFLFETTRSA
jgi:hypothetical protein